MGRYGVTVATARFADTRNTTEYRPSSYQHQRRGPAYVEGLSELTFLAIFHNWVVEVSDNRIGNPAHRDEYHKACDNE